MIAIHTPPQIARASNSQNVWDVVFWMRKAFDYATPFRAALARIVGILGEVKPTSLDLPPYEEHEDFVGGRPTFGSDSFWAYHEYSLGYLSFENSSRDSLSEMAQHVMPIFEAVPEPEFHARCAAYACHGRT